VTHPRSIGYAAKITDLFLRRFDPENKGNDETEFRESLNEIRDEIASNVQVSYVKEILMGMTEILEKTYKTNVYMNDRYALSLRLCPWNLIRKFSFYLFIL
jgi:glutamate dehydrogenase